MSMMPGTVYDDQGRPLWPQQAPAGMDNAAPEVPSTPLPVTDDHALLLAAIQARLLQAEQGFRDHAPPRPMKEGRSGNTAVLLECAEALGQLHAMFTLEVGRMQHLELEVFDVRTALAQTRAELSSTQADEKLAHHRALHDSLTALPNRSHFMDALTAAMGVAQAPDQAVMFIDLDEFKTVNDLHGHAVGDELLRIVAARLRRVVRAHDVVGRLGGDEFACLLKGLNDRGRLGHLAGEIIRVVGAPCKIGSITLSVQPSIGIACCPADGATAQALLNNADIAMYQAKRARTGHAFFGA